MIIAIAAFMLLLCVLISFHEFGHLIVAKICGMKIDTFSVGFGPKLFRIKLGETEYIFSAVIIGGYVKPAGPNFKEEINPNDPDKERYFAYQPIWKKALMIVAGPLFNFLLAFILLVTMFCYLGVPQNTKIITARQSKIGNFVPALEEGARQLRTETEYQTKSLAKMFKGEVSFKEIGGPVAVFQITKEAVKEGFWMLWSLAIILNVALGIFNLVPIPSLDGGCLLLLVLEKAFGRSLCPKLQKRIYIAGMSVLILILILSTANDIFRLLSK